MQAGFQKLRNQELNTWKSFYGSVTDSRVTRLIWKMDISNLSSCLFSILLLLCGME